MTFDRISKKTARRQSASRPCRYTSSRRNRQGDRGQDHAVDGTAAAEHLAPRPTDSPAVKLRLISTFGVCTSILLSSCESSEYCLVFKFGVATLLSTDCWRHHLLTQTGKIAAVPATLFSTEDSKLSRRTQNAASRQGFLNRLTSGRSRDRRWSSRVIDRNHLKRTAYGNAAPAQ